MRTIFPWAEAHLPTYLSISVPGISSARGLRKYEFSERKQEHLAFRSVDSFVSAMDQRNRAGLAAEYLKPIPWRFWPWVLQPRRRHDLRRAPRRPCRRRPFHRQLTPAPLPISRVPQRHCWQRRQTPFHIEILPPCLAITLRERRRRRQGCRHRPSARPRPLLFAHSRHRRRRVRATTAPRRRRRRRRRRARPRQA